MTAQRRLRPSASRKKRALPDGLANGSYRTLSCPSRVVAVREESAMIGRSESSVRTHQFDREQSFRAVQQSKEFWTKWLPEKINSPTVGKDSIII